MSRIKGKILLILGLLSLSLALVGGNVYAAKANSEGQKPGWGWGDKNHEHYGPPGLSVNPIQP